MSSINFYKDLLCFYADKINWSEVSKRADLPKDIDFYETFKNWLDWDKLYIFSNEGIWTGEMLSHFVDYIDWKKFSKYINKGVLTPNVLFRFKNNVDWRIISQRSEIEIPADLIIEFKHQIEWNWFSIQNMNSNTKNLWYNKVFWTEELIRNVQDKISLTFLTELTNVAWSESLFDRYSSRFDKEYYCWSNLSQNQSIPWNESLIETYKSKWHWDSLSGNPSLPWSEGLILRFEEFWHFRPKYHHEDVSFQMDNLNCLSRNINIYWTDKLIERFQEKLCFFRIGLFANISSSTAIKFAEKFDQIYECGHVHAEWSDFVSTYAVHKSGWEILSLNPRFQSAPQDRSFFESHVTSLFYISEWPTRENSRDIMIPEIGMKYVRGILGRFGSEQKKKVVVSEILDKKYHANLELLYDNQ